MTGDDPARCRHHVSTQLVFAGKAHPHDAAGREIVKRIVEAGTLLENDVKLVYLQNYDMELGKLITSGVDLWLNTPQAPMEASGTSGMKAALNGVPSLSFLDGWWIEACIEGVTGWTIGVQGELSAGRDTRNDDARSLYETLEGKIIPLYYREPHRWLVIMRHTIALNGSFFNTQRMLQQYVLRAYFR